MTTTNNDANKQDKDSQSRTSSVNSSADDSDNRLLQNAESDNSQQNDAPFATKTKSFHQQGLPRKEGSPRKKGLRKTAKVPDRSALQPQLQHGRGLSKASKDQYHQKMPSGAAKPGATAVANMNSQPQSQHGRGLNKATKLQHHRKMSKTAAGPGTAAVANMERRGSRKLAKPDHIRPAVPTAQAVSGSNNEVRMTREQRKMSKLATHRQSFRPPSPTNRSPPTPFNGTSRDPPGTRVPFPPGFPNEAYHVQDVDDPVPKPEIHVSVDYVESQPQQPLQGFEDQWSEDEHDDTQGSVAVGEPHYLDDDAISAASFLPYGSYDAHDFYDARDSDEDNEASLAVAQPVQDTNSMLNLLPQAQHFDATEHAQQQTLKKQEQRCRLLVTLGLFALVIIAIVLIVVLLAVDDRDSGNTIVIAKPVLTLFADKTPTMTPPQAPTLSLQEYVLTLLPDFSIKSIQQDDNSSQALAYQWLSNDTNLGNYTNSRILQRFALATIYFSLNGDKWTNSSNWLSYGAHECDWYYPDLQIVPQTTGDSPADLKLVSSTTESTYSDILNGSSPCLLYEDYLFFYMESNNVGGQLPPEVFLLSSLVSFKTKANQIQGPIPSEIGLLTNLYDLSLTGNMISGSLPSELGLLSELIFLQLGSNEVSGSIPSELGMLTKIRYIELNSNMLTNQLPSEIGQLSALLGLGFEINDLSGFLPTELGLLTQLNSTLYGHGNNLTGPIPSEIGQLSELLGISLKENALTGDLPSELGKLKRIALVDISNNTLQGTIPSTIGLLTDLQTLFADHNQLSGLVPSTIANMHSLELLTLDRNLLTSSLPSEIGLATRLRLINFGENLLTGTLFTEVGRLGNLGAIGLYLNHLSGSIPEELFRLSLSLNTLNLYSNMLTSTISASFGYLFQMVVIILRGNNLIGKIPSEIGRLRSLSTLSVLDNDLSGSVPSEIAALTNLKFFGIAGNPGLMGTLPLGLCTVPTLDISCSEKFCGCNCTCSV